MKSFRLQHILLVGKASFCCFVASSLSILKNIWFLSLYNTHSYASHLDFDLDFLPAQYDCADRKNIARVGNCPDVAIINSRFGLCLLSFCLFVFLSRNHADQMSEGS